MLIIWIKQLRNVEKSQQIFEHPQHYVEKNEEIQENPMFGAGENYLSWNLRLELVNM